MFVSVKRFTNEPWFINTKYIITVQEKSLVTPDPILNDKGEKEILQRAILTFVDSSELTMSVEDWQSLKKQIETEQRKQR